jgi:hypothetical protein
MKLKCSSISKGPPSNSNTKIIKKNALKSTSNNLSESVRKVTALSVRSSKDVENNETMQSLSGAKKRKRPWRQTVRNRAKRERLTKDVSETFADDNTS